MEKLWIHLDRESEILSIQFDRPRNDAGGAGLPGWIWGLSAHENR